MYSLNESNFNMKPSVDISAIASVLQKKKIAEAEAAQQQRAQKFQELSTTIGLASNLASNMVQHSKERQKQEFVRSLSDAMALTVPQKKTPVFGPTMDGGTLPPIMAPDTEKQNLMRAATQVAPDDAAKFAFKTANPAFGSDDLKFQRLTLPGSDGKNRTINVGVMGTQLINPITKQPFSGSPSEVDTMPEYGFVEREEYAGTDNAGNPVYRNPVSQEVYVKNEQGQAIPYRGPILPKLQNPSDQMASKVQFVAETRGMVKDAIEHFDPEFVGPIAGRTATVKEWFNGLTDEKQVEFRQMVNEINQVKRHELYGGTLTGNEKSAFDEISLDSKLSPKAFLARLKALERKLGYKESALMKSAKVSGKVFRNEGERPSLNDIFSDEE
jgi:hypothetical protein